jgi:hypothetical protein
MNTANARMVVLTMSLAVTGFVSHVAAHTEPTRRNAAIEKCTAQARREYPDHGKAEDEWNDQRLINSIERKGAYEACMDD